MENKILNMKKENCQPESRDMAIFGKSPCQNVVKFHLNCPNCWNTCAKYPKIVFLESS